MAVKTSGQLKALFENGDKPDEDDFGDLIDTIFDGTIWSAKLVVQLKGDVIVDTNDPQQTLKFQVDATYSPIFDPEPTWIFQADSSVSQTNWEFWNGTDFLQIDAAGLDPTYQDASVGLVTYTHDSAGFRNDEVYIRYRSGFGFIWSEWVVEKVVLG